MLVTAAKLSAALFLYYTMNVGSQGTFWSDPGRVYAWEQNKIALGFENAGKWPFLFVGWDTNWYLSIMTKGYAFSPQTYTFSPGLPVFGTIFKSVLQEPLISIVVCAFVFGVLWVPLFQSLTETYLNKKAALACTLLIAFSPYLFVFTTVAYAEGLVLFFTLSAWVLLKKKKTKLSSSIGALAAISRVTGVVIALPMLHSSLKQKEKNRIQMCILALAPFFALAGWYAYCLVSAGDLFAPVHTTEWSGLYTIPSFLLNNLPQRGLNAFSDILVQSWPAKLHWLTPAAIACAVFLPPLLISRMTKIGKDIAIYTATAFAGIIVFGSIVSFPRFVSVLFPLWYPLTAKMTLTKKQIIATSTVLIIFFLASINIWTNFLNGQFIA